MTDIFDHWPAPLARVSTRHCVALSIRFALEASDEELDGMLLDGETKQPLSAGDVRRIAQQHRAAGRTVFPPCDQTNAEGLCVGHPIYQLQEDSQCS